MPPITAPPVYTKKDFQTDQEVRWCPGCGDYAILNAVQSVFAKLGIPREKFVVVSGIGCSSRLPYYVNTYGFHTIHGRALAVATGVKLANPDLEVWIGTGDGDALSIGGNHLIHAIRRNVGLKILLFNNRIYGLTKGQYSPTTPLGQKNVSSPYGAVERPVNGLGLAIACGATFVAASVDVYAKHLQDVLVRAARHKGTAYVEIYQNCNVFNDGAFDQFTEREVRDDWNVVLEHGKPLVFGKNREKGIRISQGRPEIVKIGENGVTEKDLSVHDEKSSRADYAFMLSQMTFPQFPVPLGVLRAVDEPTFEQRVHEQIREVTAKRGAGDLKEMLAAGDTWEVKAK